MKKILVIGKNGYVSGCFVSYMKQFPNTIVDTITARNGKWKEKDFSDYCAVFNTIGLTHNDARAGSEEQFYELNETLPYEIAKKAKYEGVKVFIHMSSMIVYGNMAGVGQDMIINTNTIPAPNSIYGKSKLAGELKLQTLEDKKFKVAIIRSPLIYGINAPDNVEKLFYAALILPVFPGLGNSLSMIYDENLCELVRLIIMNSVGGLFFPQMDKHISTSSLVKDIANSANHNILIINCFNYVLKFLSKYITKIQKAFGNQVYELNLSNAFNGSYRVYSYKESIDKIVMCKHRGKL